MWAFKSLIPDLKYVSRFSHILHLILPSLGIFSSAFIETLLAKVYEYGSTFWYSAFFKVTTDFSYCEAQFSN